MQIIDFNLRHLRALAAAVHAGSISGAAEAIGITQPAVTQAISRLESVVGTKLLQRSPAGASATDAGILLGARAQAVAAALADAMKPVRRGGIGGRADAADTITIAQMRGFLALADGGTYVGGAERAGVSQPSLHRAVQDLERACGVPLVERSGRGIAITDAGQHLVRAFRLAAAELQAGIDELAVLAGRDQGVIRIGADAAAMEGLLPGALARFVAEHPPVVIEIADAGTDALVRLRDGHLDALIAAAGEEDLPPDLVAEGIVDEAMFIVGRAGHALAQGGTRGLVRLASFGWALPPGGTPERNTWEGMFLDGGLYPPRPNLTCSSRAAILKLVAASDLLGIAPQAAVSAAGTALATIGAPLASRSRIVLVTRAGWAPSPAQATFLDEVRAATRKVLQF